MAPKKQQPKKGAPPAPTAARGQKITPVVRKDGKPTRREKSLINKAKAKEHLKAFHAERKKLIKEVVGDIPRTKRGCPKVLVDDDKDRPTEYSEELAQHVCKLFTKPGMTLSKLNSMPELPTAWTFYEWKAAHPHIENLYNRARDVQFDIGAEDLETISAETLPGIIKVTRISDKDGTTTETREVDAIERAKLRIETRKWLLAKLRPKKYGAQPLELADNNPLKDLLAQFRQRNSELSNG